jgi:molybdopterin-guanine dinucleotide biosynthesis protein A
MGRDKSWLAAVDDDDTPGAGAEPLLHRVCRIAQAACPCVIVVGRRGVSLPVLPVGTVRVDDDDDGPSGPLAGTVAGLRAALERGAEVAYLGACDAAWLSTIHVEAMLQALERGDARAVVPTGGQRDDGTAIVHATSGAVRVAAALATAVALLAAGERALRGLYAALAATHIDAANLPDPGALRCCNTPEQLVLARAHWVAHP